VRTRASILAVLLALLAVVGLAVPAHAQEEGGDGEATELSHESEECIEAVEEADDPDACVEAPSPILPPTNELIWGAISFVVLFVLLGYFAYPGIKKSMEARSQRIRDDLEGAEGAKAEAQQVLDEYRAQLADAKTESGRIIDEARQAAEAFRREQEQRLQAELAEIRARSAADIEAAKAQAIADLRGEVAELAVGAAEVVVGRNLDRETQTQLVEQYIASVGSRN
jgi:F-type H+-transporting ATPase subunit b